MATQTCGTCAVAQREAVMLRCGVTGQAADANAACRLSANDVLRLQRTAARIAETVADRYDDSAPGAQEVS